MNEKKDVDKTREHKGNMPFAHDSSVAVETSSRPTGSECITRMAMVLRFNRWL